GVAGDVDDRCRLRPWVHCDDVDGVAETTPLGSRESLPTTRKNSTWSGWPLVKLAPAAGGTFWIVNHGSPLASGSPGATPAAITRQATSTPHNGGPISVSTRVRVRAVIASPSPWSSPRPARPAA